MDALIAGFGQALTPYNIAFVALGVAIGYLVGALPGLGKGTATAVAIPITFYIAPLTAIAFLVGISKGSAAGSAVSAILMNTPGEPSSAPTALAGYPLARAGKAQKALKMGLFASVIGDFVSTCALILLAQTLADYALAIGPIELVAILAFSLTFIAALSGKSLVKGMIAGLFGILCATVGLEVETSTERLIFGFYELYDGLPLIPVAIGMLALSEMMVQIGNRRRLEAETDLLRGSGKPEDAVVTWDDWKRSARAIVRGTFVGIFIGILPGLGASTGSFLSYGMARRAAKDPEAFERDGAIEGVAAAESADNAVVPASFVPLFALGIPGSVIAAILIGAFIIQGVTPGPLMFIEQADLMQGIYASMLVASLILLCIGYFGQNLFARVIKLSPSIVLSAVVFLCCLGSYLQGGGMFGLYIMAIFAVIGFFARKYDFSFVTFLIGFVIGEGFELALRQTIGLLKGTPEQIFDHPIAIVFWALTLLGVVAVVRRQRASSTPAA
ncbi:MAG: tripartite tricarboxylate transporter permease [Alphaproteobacteria bacterium]|nr:tripartite tricarboxylate transporter permease [Alphaproteobacteria bacterium]MCB9929330.1 tripartite tricarboxylate transporter permease [Alphaproteobacteria bacterium]